MKSKERRREMYEHIKQNKELNVTAMATHLGVSCMTIRRDLIAMEQEGLITRSYGKAMLKNDSANDVPFSERIESNYEFKLLACEEAVKLIHGVSTIYMDGSSTCFALSTLLPTDQSLTVVTSNLSVAVQLRNMRNIRVVLPGGTLGTDTNTIDTDSVHLIPEGIFVDMAFFSCGGFSEKGFVNSNLNGSYISNYYQRVAPHVALIVDHTKYQKHGLFSVWDWSNITHFVTDLKPSPGVLRQISKHGIQALWHNE